MYVHPSGTITDDTGFSSTMKAADAEVFMQSITRRTTLSTGVVRNVQESEVETLIDMLGEARPVHSGVAIFTPSIDIKGNVNVSVRVDKRILSALNSPDVFNGRINNRQNIGLTCEQYIALWNQDQPDNPILP